MLITFNIKGITVIFELVVFTDNVVESSLIPGNRISFIVSLSFGLRHTTVDIHPRFNIQESPYVSPHYTWPLSLSPLPPSLHYLLFKGQPMLHMMTSLSMLFSGVKWWYVKWYTGFWVNMGIWITLLFYHIIFYQFNCIVEVSYCISLIFTKNCKILPFILQFSFLRLESWFPYI